MVLHCPASERQLRFAEDRERSEVALIPNCRNLGVVLITGQMSRRDVINDTGLGDYIRLRMILSCMPKRRPDHPGPFPPRSFI